MEHSLFMTLNYPSLSASSAYFIFYLFGNDSININGYKKVQCYICPLIPINNFLCIYYLSIINYYNYTSVVYI